MAKVLHLNILKTSKKKIKIKHYITVINLCSFLSQIITDKYKYLLMFPWTFHCFSSFSTSRVWRSCPGWRTCPCPLLKGFLLLDVLHHSLAYYDRLHHLWRRRKECEVSFKPTSGCPFLHFCSFCTFIMHFNVHRHVVKC